MHVHNNGAIHGSGRSGTNDGVKVEVAAPSDRFVLQPAADRLVVLTDGRSYAPLATLKNEFDDVAHIVQEESDYVLITGTYVGGFHTNTHWFTEAIAVLFGLTAEMTVSFRK